MSNVTKHLASFNLARARFETGSEEMSHFETNLVPVNELADRAEGFVWRLKSDTPGVPIIDDIFDDPQMLLNLTIWTSLETLFEFSYRTVHKKIMARNVDKFDTHKAAYHVMWWIDEGDHPFMALCKAKLDQLDAAGPSPDAFSWAAPFDVDGKALQSFVPNRVLA